MIETRIKELLAAKEKSLWWLHKQSGIAYPTLWKLRDSKTASIDFRVLEAICTALQCTPNDVLVILPDKKKGGSSEK